MDDKLQKIIDYLNHVKTRCTDGTIAEVLGVNSQSVGMMPGQRRPEVSWVVNAKTGHSTDYLDSEKHPDLYRTERIITSASVLRRNLKV